MIRRVPPDCIYRLRRRNFRQPRRVLGHVAIDFRDGKTFPRPGRQPIGGVLWLARLFDKARAAAAGTIFDYIYPCPMDRGVMERWGIAPETFDEAIATHRTDDAIHRWLSVRVAPERIAEANRWLLVEKAENLDRQDAEEGRTRRTPMGQTIEYPRPDGAKAPGYLALPADPEHAPGIVLIEEWWGVNDNIKSIADAYAAAGYRTLVPDLYRGRVAATGDEANHLMQGLDFIDAATQDVRGAAVYLKRQRAKVGVTGYCMGGALTLLASMHVPELDAAVVFYGYPPPEAGDPATISIPLMAHWAKRDEFFKSDGIAPIEERLKAGGVAHEFYWYDTGHAFSNPGGIGNYDAAAAQLAWERTLEFWNRTLR